MFIHVDWNSLAQGSIFPSLQRMLRVSIRVRTVLHTEQAINIHSFIEQVTIS